MRGGKPCLNTGAGREHHHAGGSMSDEAIALGILLATLERIAVSLEKIAAGQEAYAAYLAWVKESHDAPDTKPET